MDTTSDAKPDLSWIPFYEEFADKLLPYQSRRGELINLLQASYKECGIRFPKIEDGDPIDIDPFTIYGMFNKHMTDANRTKLSGSIARALGVLTPAPTSFPGIPMVNNLGATFYRFKDRRGETDINQLWGLFRAALSLSSADVPDHRNAFIQAYDAASALKGIAWNITIALFWIRPNSFVSLDSRSRWYIGKKCALGTECAGLVTGKEGIPNGHDYLDICGAVTSAISSSGTYGSIADLSNEAFVESDLENKHQKDLKSQQPSSESSISQSVLPIGEPVDDVHKTKYWTFSPGPMAQEWGRFQDAGVMALGFVGVDDVRDYPSKDAIASALKAAKDGTTSRTASASMLWQFVHEMSLGDVVFARRGLHKVIGYGIVTGEYDFDPDAGSEYSHVRRVDWRSSDEVDYPAAQMALNTLTTIKKSTVIDQLISAYAISRESRLIVPDGDASAGPSITTYTREDFLSDVFMEPSRYDRLASLLKTKKNVILQGAPGVGKTYMAERLAFSLMGKKERDYIQMVQFHQSYSYEDFFMGYRPTDTGFELKPGAFFTFCNRAAEDPSHDYFFLIDEINRGNLSKIFGEVFMLIESDKRGCEVTTMYTDEPFSVPSNVYLIGMMNTADRSLALMDFALRRRFAFFDVVPGFMTAGFKSYQQSINNPQFDSLITAVISLNQEIEKDPALGPGFRVGHSFFCNLDKFDGTAILPLLHDILEFEVIPLLQEYWFDDRDKAEHWSGLLRKSLAGVDADSSPVLAP